jgi:hypothetical protein
MNNNLTFYIIHINKIIYPKKNKINYEYYKIKTSLICKKYL